MQKEILLKMLYLVFKLIKFNILYFQNYILIFPIDFTYKKDRIKKNCFKRNSVTIF